ncbi:protein phosphatase 1 regulatory subunit 42-like isoform X2 [Babylonia areolata]|uniref:protein phosphatase 1 regulatory subunit 42-like isoform X2 n=1 Tax=Babylonia areolata TaxID=304850 RepID=UPI003FD0F4DF
MVRLTAELMAKSSSGYTKKKKEESAQSFAKRLTHLYLESKGITEVSDDLALCRNLVVLYLYDNQLTEVPCLNFNCSLTHLYLQNNSIIKITNLSALTKLSKLYLGGNCITVVEGLEKLEQLQELHVEHQHLPPGEQLLFDPRCLQALSGHLEVLNVSGNNLESLSDLRDLRSLTQLFAADNQLNDMRDLSQLLATWTRLWRLELVGNPLCHKPKYKDRIIVMCRKLGMLDGKEITDTARQFLRNWHEIRETNKKKRDEITRQQSFLTEVGGGIKGSKGHELPPVSAPNRVSSGISGYLMPGLPRKEFEDILSRNSSGDSRASSKPRSGILGAKLPAIDNNRFLSVLTPRLNIDKGYL